MIFNNDILKITNNKRDFYSPIISALVETKSIEFFLSKGFHLFALPIMNDAVATKEKTIQFNFDHQNIELNSSQAMRISALSAFYNQVFSVSKCFRNEKNVDFSHLSEFTMLEAEFSIEKETDIFDLIENYLAFIIDWFDTFIVEQNLTDVFKHRTVSFPIEQINYDLLLKSEKIKGKKLIFDHFDFCDIDVSADIDKPIFIVNYPCVGSWRAKRKDNLHAFLYNLILPCGFGELVECSIREIDYAFYKQKFDYLGMSESYSWYLDAMRINHGIKAGFGLGLERLAAWLMDLKAIGDQLIFPRLPGGQ